MGSLDTIGGGSAGGGGSVDPVTPPAAQSQSVAQGGSFSAVTFGAFTDSGGRISSYGTPTVVNVVGSGTVSGSGLGPYSFSGTADGEVLTVELPALDSGGNVLATATFTGNIAGSPPSSELLATWDFRTADTGTLSGSGNITTGSGATTIVGYNVFIQSGTPTATTDITSAGLRIHRSDTNGISGIALDLGAVLALCDSARDTLLVFVHFAAISNATMVNNQNLSVVAASCDFKISKTPTRGLFLNNTNATTLSIRVREYDGSVTVVTESAYGSAWPTSGTALLEISGTRVFAGWSDAANPARSAVNVASAGISSGDTAPASTPATPMWTDLIIAPNPQVGGDIQLTVSHVNIYRLAAGAS